MKNATVMNDNVQEIRKILEEYIGKRKAAKVAVEISAVMQGETRHTHRGEVFFVHKDETGRLVLTTEPVVKRNVQTLLQSYLEEDELQKCIESLMAENNEMKESVEPKNNKASNSDTPIYTKPIKHEPKIDATKLDKTILIPGPYDSIETITVEGSGSENYNVLMTHKPQNDKEWEFMKNLEIAINAKVGSFRVPVNDPSIDINGKIQFAPGFKPATGYSYSEWEKLAKKNGLRIGTKDEYILFMGWLITSLMNEGWSEKDAWFAVCTDSRELGHYWNSLGHVNELEPTGSRMIAGKCDLANVCKYLARDEKKGRFWSCGGFYVVSGRFRPLAFCYPKDAFYGEFPTDYAVCWFVL